MKIRVGTMINNNIIIEDEQARWMLPLAPNPQNTTGTQILNFLLSFYLIFNIEKLDTLWLRDLQGEIKDFFSMKVEYEWLNVNIKDNRR